MRLQESMRYVIVGAGIHGLSTAYHLAKELRMRGLGSGADVVVLDKAHAGAGASGIACGVVRNNYFQPAMSELMQACVEVWECDPVAYAYNPVGYIALGADPVAILTTSAMAAPAGLYLSKILLPEKEVPVTRGDTGSTTESTHANVVDAAASWHNQLTAAATSTGVTRRPSGLVAMRAARASSAERPVRAEICATLPVTRSVSVYPGHTAFTVTPRFATSIASERVSPTTACFAAL